MPAGNHRLSGARTHFRESATYLDKWKPIFLSPLINTKSRARIGGTSTYDRRGSRKSTYDKILIFHKLH